MATKKLDTAAVAGQTDRVPPSALRMYQRNPRKGNVGVVASSLQAHGQYRPIVANIGTHTGRANEVLAGNHTLKAFRSLAQKHPEDERWSAILVHWVDVDDDQAKRIVLADNKTRTTSPTTAPVGAVPR
jgi:ParB-like chromosome segregation protein Spo0J